MFLEHAEIVDYGVCLAGTINDRLELLEIQSRMAARTPAMIKTQSGVATGIVMEYEFTVMGDYADVRIGLMSLPEPLIPERPQNRVVG